MLGRRRATCAALTIVAIGCGRVGYGLGAGTDSGPLPDGSSDAAADAGPLPIFDPPTPIMGGPSSPNVDDPTLTGDRLQLFFNESQDIYWTSRASTTSAWDTPAVVMEVSSGSITESSPEISTDGLTLHFSRNTSSASYDLYFATRAIPTGTFGNVTRIDELSTNDLDTNPAAFGATRMVFCTGPSAATRNIYETTRPSGTGAWNMPVERTELNTADADAAPILSRGGLLIVFYSDRPGTDGEDLFMAERASLDDAFTNVRPIDELNTAADESDPWISEDGRHIVFVRDGTLMEASR